MTSADCARLVMISKGWEGMNKEYEMHDFNLYCTFYDGTTMEPTSIGQYVLWVQSEAGDEAQGHYMLAYWDVDDYRWFDESGEPIIFDFATERVWWSPQLREVEIWK